MRTDSIAARDRRAPAVASPAPVRSSAREWIDSGWGFWSISGQSRAISARLTGQRLTVQYLLRSNTNTGTTLRSSCFDCTNLIRCCPCVVCARYSIQGSMTTEIGASQLKNRWYRYLLYPAVAAVLLYRCSVPVDDANLHIEDLAADAGPVRLSHLWLHGVGTSAPCKSSQYLVLPLQVSRLWGPCGTCTCGVYLQLVPVTCTCTKVPCTRHLRHSLLLLWAKQGCRHSASPSTSLGICLYKARCR
ncbi:hypothetical protein V8C42DRAFT_234895 [Trichoderma barbatum]